MNMNVSVASVTKVRPSLEEILNAVTHGIGAALSVAALVGMLFHYANGGVWHLTSLSGLWHFPDSALSGFNALS
jgi:predicted membrane channel-forming protein YqfA (hemolysin III family)